jgi:hypothetical protein
MGMVGREPHRQQIEAAPAGRRVEQADGLERVRIEQVRKVADSVSEVDEPAIIGPLLVVLGVGDAEDVVRRLSGLDRCHHLVRKLLLGMENELDLLAGLFLEGRDDLPDGLVLLGVAAFVPPDDESAALAASGTMTIAAARMPARLRMTQPP